MLVLENVTKKFRKREALKGISVRIEEGCYGLLGPNGAGKTTLLRCVLGLYPVSSGSISLDGKPADIGYLPQKFGMFQELTAYDMLYYFAAVKKIPKDRRKSEIENVLALVNLNDRIREKVGKLSGGMQRRLGIAQALLGDPGLIFLDEPTAGLDPEERVRFRDIIGEIRENRTILISTHIVEDVESTCDRVIIMNEGQVLENVTIEEACAFSEQDDSGKEPSLADGYLARIRGV